MLLRLLAERLVRQVIDTAMAYNCMEYWLPLREIKRGTPPNEEPYLNRYYLFGKEPAYFPRPCKWCGRPMRAFSASFGAGDELRPCDIRHRARGVHEVSFCERKPFPARLSFLPTVFLHHFLDSDQEEELHNHPWSDSFSFILAGGYIEERRIDKEDSKVQEVVTRFVRPFTFNRIRSSDFHRVKLVERDAWTVFITGEKVQSWGFWSKTTGEFVHWKQYRAWKEAQLPSRKDNETG